MGQTERSQVDLEGLKGFLDSFVLPFSGQAVKSKALIYPEGQHIYHYTDLGALSSIVSGHDLWLTNSQYSNDEDESRHGYVIARNVVENYLRKAKPANPQEKLKVEYVQTLYSIIKELPPEGFYICCFCEADNLLSQWRSYGANGTGVSLGFEPDKFVEIAGWEDMPQVIGLMRLWKVSYNIFQQKAVVQHAIEFVWEHRSTRDTQQLATRAADAIQYFVPTFKNADFREEKERRLIFTPNPNCEMVKPRYRVGRGMLIPYYSVRDLAEAAYREIRGMKDYQWKLPLHSITVGPSAQKALNVASAKMLLEQNGYGDVEVKASDTPYRG